MTQIQTSAQDERKKTVLFFRCRDLSDFSATIGRDGSSFSPKNEKSGNRPKLAQRRETKNT